MSSVEDKLGFTEPEEKQREISVSTQEVSNAAKGDLDFLAALAMPEIFSYRFPPVFLSVWQWLLSYTVKVRDFSQLALGLPRGFGKTTLIKIYVLWCILFSNKRFILVISSTASLATNIISDIADMLDEPNIKKTFGDWRLGLEIDRQELKKFGFRGRNIILAGIGAGTSLRGLNIKNQRPDVMIFEDIQTREGSESVIESDNLEKWMFSTAMKAKSPSGCLFIFVANMYPTKGSILRKLKTNPRWTKFIVGGILASGESLWEELQPLSQLMQEFENDLLSGHPEIFYSEVLNDENASANNLIDISKLPVFPFKDDDISAGNFIIIDPATDKANADAVSIGYFEVHDTKPCMLEVIEGRFSPGDTIREAIKIALRKNCRLIAIESNAYQYSLLYWFGFICQQMGIEGIEAVEIYSGGYSKNSRILSMFKQLSAGEIYYHPRTASLVNLQITQFAPLRRDNVDGILDLLTYAPKVLEMYGDSISAHSIIEAQEWNTVGVVEDNSLF